MNVTLLEKLESLPPAQQQVLLDFADYLARKHAPAKPLKKKKRQAGTFHGFLVYMAR